MQITVKYVLKLLKIEILFLDWSKIK
jgi:hypothetical protein